MKIKQTVKYVLITLVMAFAVASFGASTTYAEDCIPSEAQSCCGGVKTSIIACDETGGTDGGIENTGVWGILIIVINIMTAGVGILAVAGIVYGSVLYTSAGGSAEQVKKAIGVITNVVIGLLAYALMFAFLNFIIPGGLFN